MTQQTFVVGRYLWSSLRRNFAEDAIILIHPMVKLLWGDHILL